MDICGHLNKWMESALQLVPLVHILTKEELTMCPDPGGGRAKFCLLWAQPSNKYNNKSRLIFKFQPYYLSLWSIVVGTELCFYDIPTTTAAQRLVRNTLACHYKHFHSTGFGGGGGYNALHCSDAGSVCYAVLDAAGQYGSCWLSAKLWLLSQRPL